MNTALDFEGLDGILTLRVGDEDELAPPAHDGAMVQLGVQPLAGRPWEGHRGAEPVDTEWPTVVADSAPMYADGAPALVSVEGPSMHEQVELPDAGDEAEGDAFGLRLDGADHRRDEIPDVGPASVRIGDAAELRDPGLVSARVGDGAASIRSTVASVRVGDGAGRARSGEAVGAVAPAATVPAGEAGSTGPVRGLVGAAGVRAPPSSQGLLAVDGVAPPAESGGNRGSSEGRAGAGVPYESAPRRGPTAEGESSADGRGAFASAVTPPAGPGSELRPTGGASPARPLPLIAALAAAAVLTVAVLGALAVWSGLEGSPARTPTPGGPQVAAAEPGSDAGSMEPRAVAQEGAAAAHPPEPPASEPGSTPLTPEPGAPEPGPTSPSTQPASRSLTSEPGAASLATAPTSLAAVPAARVADVPSSSERVFVVRFAYGDETPLSRLLPDWVATCPRLVVVGHTDDRGTEASNAALGLARARAAYALAHANPRASDEVTSAGAARPASDNTTPEGRRLNRRAEITCR